MRSRFQRAARPGTPPRSFRGQLRGHAGRRYEPIRWWAGRVWADHWLITVAVGLSAVPRVLASLAFRPALFTPDSFGYLAVGVHLVPGRTRPSGYPLLLRVLEPFHSLLVITTIQHLMGIATAVLGYAVLRRWGLPAWGAVLAAAPTLFDSRQVELESAILPDALYALTLMAAVAIVLTGGKPAVRRCAMAGLLLALAALTRANGAAAMVAVLAVLVLQRAGWKAAAAAGAAFAVPVAAYMAAVQSAYGSFALTESAGFFAWSRTMSFAKCAVIKPPADLRALCPERQPGYRSGPAPAWSVPALLDARTPASYLWARGTWWRQGSHPGMNAANNARAMRFAVAAIRAQPAAYLRTVAAGVMLTFLATDRSLGVHSLHFTAEPDVRAPGRAEMSHLQAYAHIRTNTYPVQPYAYLLYLYQQPVYFPGIIFGLVMLAGLAGVARHARRRGRPGARFGPSALPWAVAATGIVVPVAVHEYHYRYVITVIPLACLAAGLAFARPRVEQDRSVNLTVGPLRVDPEPEPDGLR